MGITASGKTVEERYRERGERLEKERAVAGPATDGETKPVDLDNPAAGIDLPSWPDTTELLSCHELINQTHEELSTLEAALAAAVAAERIALGIGNAGQEAAARVVAHNELDSARRALEGRQAREIELLQAAGPAVGVALHARIGALRAAYGRASEELMRDIAAKLDKLYSLEDQFTQCARREEEAAFAKLQIAVNHAQRDLWRLRAGSDLPMPGGVGYDVRSLRTRIRERLNF